MSIETRVVDATTGAAKGQKPERYDLLPYNALDHVAREYAMTPIGSPNTGHIWCALSAFTQGLNGIRPLVTGVCHALAIVERDLGGTLTPTIYHEGATLDDATVAGYADFPFRALDEVGRLFHNGAQKYLPWNWYRGYAYSLSIGAAGRHTALYRQGVVRDEEMHVHHLACTAWHLLVLLTYELERRGTDDRMCTIRKGFDAASSVADLRG